MFGTRAFRARSLVALLVMLASLPALGTGGGATAQSVGEFALTLVTRRCDDQHLVLQIVANGNSGQVAVNFYNTSTAELAGSGAGVFYDGYSTVVVPTAGEVFDKVEITVNLASFAQYVFMASIGACDTAFAPDSGGQTVSPLEYTVTDFVATCEDDGAHLSFNYDFPEPVSFLIWSDVTLTFPVDGGGSDTSYLGTSWDSGTLRGSGTYTGVLTPAMIGSDDQITIESMHLDLSRTDSSANILDAAYTFAGCVFNRLGVDPIVTTSISNATCVSFDWTDTSDTPVTITTRISVPAAAGEFPSESQAIAGGEISGTFVTGVNWPAMVQYLEVSYTNIYGDDVIISQETFYIEDCAAVAPTPVPTMPPVQTETPPPTSIPAESSVTIVITMHDGSSLEGAPWALYGEMASMQALPPLATGVVGTGNTIVLTGVPNGRYRLVISPEGRDPISLDITVAVGADGSQAIQIDLGADATPVVPTTIVPVPTATTGVSALPSTGSGAANAGTMVVLSVLATFVIVGSALGIRHRGLSR